MQKDCTDKRIAYARRAKKANPRAWMGCAVSLIVLGCALFVVLSDHYDGSIQKWAFGAIGTILTWWLKPDSR